MRTSTKISTRDWQMIAKALSNGEAFRTHGSLKGAPVEGALTNWDMGRLPRELYTSAMFASYVIWSYSTPVAWLDADGEWQVPDVRYSVTTGRQQSTVRTAVSRVKGEI